MKKYKKIYIEITNKCNLNCSFCSKIKRPKREMNLNEFKEILNKIHNYTDYIYLHIKGEPLLNNNIIDMINEAAKYNLRVNLTTNGMLFSKYAKELGLDINSFHVCSPFRGHQAPHLYHLKPQVLSCRA